MLRILLGARLGRPRGAASIPAEKAGCEFRASRSKISRTETGRAWLSVEPAATAILTFGTRFVTGPFQTEHCARAVTKLGRQLSGEALAPAETARFIQQVAHPT